MENAKKVLDHQLNEYKLDNIKRLFWPALFIYLGISFVDASLSPSYGAETFFFLRLFFFSPYMLIYAFRKKLNLKYIQAYGFIIFFSVALGVCFVSYLLGGIQSEYYFGVLIISFTQFVAMPFRTRETIILEALIITLYFTINTLPFDISPELFSKQLSNFISYAIIKIVVSGSFYNTVANSIRSKDLQKRLEQRENIQLVFGEMCHLFNNPLFISQAMLQKAKKVDGDEQIKHIDKAMEANLRIQGILKEIQEVQTKKEIELENPETLKEILRDKNKEPLRIT